MMTTDSGSRTQIQQTGPTYTYMYLTDEAWPDLETYFGTESLALVPLGSMEQHGPHLPEGTDHIIAET